MLLSQLLRAPIGSRLIRTDFDDDTLTLGIATTYPNASCPICGHDTWRVHSRYDRSLAEESVFGHRVCLRMTVRRFFCSGSACPRRIFTEPLDGFAAKHARTTIRLAQTHFAIGSALGGEAGARLAKKTAVPTSPDTLLRRVKQAGARSSGAPRFVGIDDWAWCKGQRYGTIVVDLETNDVIDLLPDRDAATVRTWLEAHPGIELLSRDRSSAYSQAASEAAPKAQQVADRWHLLKNVREAIERLFERHLPIITEALKPADPDPKVGPTYRPATNPTPQRPRSQLPRNRRRSRFRYHLDTEPRSPSGSGASNGSSGFMNSVVKGRRSDRSPESSISRRMPSPLPSSRAMPRLEARAAPHVRGWTSTGSGSTPASPKGGSTHPSCTVSWRREEFASRTGRSVAISPSDWDGPARRAPSQRCQAKACCTTLAEATLIRLGPSP